MREAVRALPQLLRESVMMFYFNQMSVKQIADILEVNENTVKSRLYSARQSMKKYLEQYGGAALASCAVPPMSVISFSLIQGGKAKEYSDPVRDTGRRNQGSGCQSLVSVRLIAYKSGGCRSCVPNHRRRNRRRCDVRKIERGYAVRAVHRSFLAFMHDDSALKRIADRTDRRTNNRSDRSRQPHRD